MQLTKNSLAPAPPHLISTSLGILFAMLSARGEEINETNIAEAVRVIRGLFPVYDRVFFRKPAPETMSLLIRAVENETFPTFAEKMNALLRGMSEA